MIREKLVIVGNGPAGCTAAVYAARANLSPLVLAGSLPGGLLTQTTHVENFPGFPEGITGFDLVMGMQQQAERFGARIEYDEIIEFQLTDGEVQTLKLASGETVETTALILATGASPRYLGIPSEERLRNKGVSACATCDGAFYRDVPVAVLGGGDSAMEEAIFLTRFASKVHVIHRRAELRASPIMAERARANPKIEFVWSSEVLEVLGENKVTGLRVKNLQSGAVSELVCSAVFVALGHVPNTALFREFVTTDAAGYVVLKGDTSLTNLAGVFAAGDCADPRYRQAITASGMGCRAAIDAERYLESRHG